MDKLSRLYVYNVVRPHGVLKDIVSDRDSQFLSNFWQKLQTTLGTKLNFSTTFHVMSDGQMEMTIQTLEDMLYAYVMEWQGNLDSHMSLVEFAYNNSFQASIGMAPFEALYGRQCCSPLNWDDSSHTISLGPQMIEEMTYQMKLIQKNENSSRLSKEIC